MKISVADIIGLMILASIVLPAVVWVLMMVFGVPIMALREKLRRKGLQKPSV